jgi:hypothetical protein
VIPREPGEYAWKRFLRLSVPIVSLLFLTIVLATVAILGGPRWWSADALAVVALVLEQWRERKHDPFPWLYGARGEEAVARALSELTPLGYRALHDIPTGRGNVDHVVVGLTGVFAIETKNWRGAFFPRQGRLVFNGRDATRLIKQATAEAMEIGRRLRTAGLDRYVPALIVSTRAAVLGGPLTFRSATVIELKDLASTIRAARSRPMVEQEVARAVAAILRGDHPVSVTAVSQDSWPAS